MWAYSWKLHGAYACTQQGSHIESRPASVLRLRRVIAAVHQVPIDTLRLLASDGSYLSDAAVLSDHKPCSIVAWAPAFIGPWQSGHHTDANLLEDDDGTVYWARKLDEESTPDQIYLVEKDTTPEETSESSDTRL